MRTTSSGGCSRPLSWPVTIIPGRGGWRQRQRALTERWLTTPARLFDGERPLDVMYAFRRELWSTAGPPARCVILGEIEPLLRDPVAVPDGEPAALVWLLDQMVRAYASPSAAICRRRSSRPPTSASSGVRRPIARRESPTFPQLLVLHELLSITSCSPSAVSSSGRPSGAARSARNPAGCGRLRRSRGWGPLRSRSGWVRSRRR